MSTFNCKTNSVNTKQPTRLQELFFNPISPTSQACFLKALCTPSNKIIKDPPHKVWVCVNKSSGVVESAYCTCSAGYMYVLANTNYTRVLALVLALLIFRLLQRLVTNLNIEITLKWLQNYKLY